jgi:copper(I)-binding protein
MKSTVLRLALALAPLTTAASVNDYELDALEIQQPWARATPKGAKTAAGYVAIKNTGNRPDRLTGGSLAGAGRGEIHDTLMDGGVMKMRPLPEGIEIKPGVALRLGRMHLMFTDRPVKGQSVKGTLTFANAGTLDVVFVIKGMGASAGSATDFMPMDPREDALTGCGVAGDTGPRSPSTEAVGGLSCSVPSCA